MSPADGPRPDDAIALGDVPFRQIADAMPQIVWSTLPDGFHDYYNAQWYSFTGVPSGSTDGEGWNGMFHPEDQDAAWARWRHSLDTGEPYEIAYRLRHHSGEYRWTLGRALPIRDGNGRIIRWIGTCTDIDEAKRLADQNFILSRELSHRIKNIFAVLNGLIGMSARQYPEMKALAESLRARVSALGRAHDFVRPHSEQSAPIAGPTTLRTMLADLLSPYPAIDEGRLTIAGDDLPIDDRGATPIGLVFHELATNASKYGALSVPDGRVEITSERRGEQVVLRWEETGGPSIEREPALDGFGTKLTELSIVRQLGGTLERQWRRSGLIVEMTISVAALSRGASA